MSRDAKRDPQDLPPVEQSAVNEPMPIGRREAIKRGGEVVLGITGAVLAAKAGIKNAIAGTLKPANEKHESEGEPENEKPVGSRALDIGTALLVAGNFGRHVLWRGAIKGHDLGPRSAAEMNALAWMRIAALKALGDEKTANLAGHEIHEIEGGLLPMPLLVALSDATTTELKVDAPLIFEAVKDSHKAPVKYENIERPKFPANIAEWEKHLQQVNTDITKKTAQIAAITSVMAPLGTTYTSSSLANDLKEEILRMLYEQSLSLGVIEAKRKAGEKPDDEESELYWLENEREEIRKAAYKRADDLFNGSMGYSKLMFALAANTQGSWGLGDPPEIYFAIDYINDPITLLKAHGVGALNSEAYTILLNAMWLQKVGALSPKKGLGEFLSALKTTVAAIIRSVSNKDLRSTSFNGNERHVQGVLAALSDKTDPSGKLRKLLQSLPKPRIRFSLKDYLAKKAGILSGKTKRMEQIASSVIATPEDFACSGVFSELVRAFNAGDRKGAKKMIEAVEARLQETKATDLSVLFEGLMDEEVAANEAGETEGETPAEAPPKAGKTHTERIMDEVSHVLVGMDDNTRKGRIEDALEILGIGYVTGETGEKPDKRKYGAEVYEALRKADEKTIARAISQFTSVEGHEDIVPGMDDDAKLGEDVAEAKQHAAGKEHAPSFLSHSAKEVLWALLTQIPSVPAISRLADISIPAINGVKENETPTTAQLKRIVATLLPIEAGMSGVADNVAAYMFARIVMMGFFERTFGQDVFKEFPTIKGSIGIIAKMIAEQAGSLTKVGNGPNFSQEKCVILSDNSNRQGISIDRVNVPMGETLPHKNVFSSVANGTLVFGAIGYLWRQIDEIAEARAKKTPAQVTMNRREALTKWFGGRAA